METPLNQPPMEMPQGSMPMGDNASPMDDGQMPMDDNEGDNYNPAKIWCVLRSFFIFL